MNNRGRFRLFFCCRSHSFYERHFEGYAPYFFLHRTYERQFGYCGSAYCLSSVLWRKFSWCQSGDLSFISSMKDILAIAARHFIFHRFYEGHFHDANQAICLSLALWRTIWPLQLGILSFIGFMKDIFMMSIRRIVFHQPHEGQFGYCSSAYCLSSVLWRTFSRCQSGELSFISPMKDNLAIAARHIVFHRFYEGHFHDANQAICLSLALWRTIWPLQLGILSFIGFMKDIFMMSIRRIVFHQPHEGQFGYCSSAYCLSSVLWRTFSRCQSGELSFISPMKDNLAIAARHIVFHRFYEGHFHDVNQAICLSSALWRTIWPLQLGILSFISSMKDILPVTAICFVLHRADEGHFGYCVPAICPS